MLKTTESFTRYLPTGPDTAKWGWQLIDAGRQIVSPGASYPRTGHPLRYLFDKNGKRTLEEFQVVFILSGSGSFESCSCPSQSILAGDSFILFPGEWHRYAPSIETGWNEYWMGFNGSDARRVMDHFFSRTAPVQRGQHTDEVLQLFDHLLHLLGHPIPRGDHIPASLVPVILAYLRAGGGAGDDLAAGDSRMVMTAKSQMLANLSERTDLEGLAQAAGCSYSRFRTIFKEETGYSPREFENTIKLNRSRDLLLSGGYNVSQTAEALGYSSVYYFSRAFRKAFGLSPMNWLREQG